MGTQRRTPQRRPETAVTQLLRQCRPDLRTDDARALDFKAVRLFELGRGSSRLRTVPAVDRDRVTRGDHLGLPRLHICPNLADIAHREVLTVPARLGGCGGQRARTPAVRLVPPRLVRVLRRRVQRAPQPVRQPRRRASLRVPRSRWRDDRG